VRQFLSVFKAAKADSPPKNKKNHDHQASGATSGEDDRFRQIAALRSELVTLHRRTGEVEHCSVSNEEFINLGADELLGQAFLDRLHIADRPACLAAFSEAYHHSGQVRVEVRLCCPSLEDSADVFCWVEIVCSAFEGPAEEGRKVLCISRDISHWKERERDLIAAQQSAMELADRRLRFLDKMSYELRTPLNAIIGFSEMMKLPGLATQNEQQMTQYAGIIHDSGRHLLGVVDEIFDMSQFEAGNYEPAAEVYRVGDLVASSVEFVQSALQKKDVQLVVGSYNEELQINSDQRVCRLALVELLSAQLQQVDTGSKIDLSIAIDRTGQEAGLLAFRTTARTGNDTNGSDMASACGQLKNCVDLLGGTFAHETSQTGTVDFAIKIPQGQVNKGSEKLRQARNIVVLGKGSKAGDQSVYKSA